MTKDIAAKDPAHLVRFFKDTDELVEGVCDFITTGLELGDTAFLAVTNAHAARIRRELSARGYGAGLAETVFFDAERLAEELIGPRGVRHQAYERLIVGEVAAASARARSGSVRAYGEIVDVLWKWDREDDALALERRWHETCAAQPLRLLCGYRLSLMECRCLDIVETHDALVLGDAQLSESEKARRAVDDLLGSQAGMLRALIQSHRQLSRLPFEQAAMLWMGRHMPASAARLAKTLAA